jgi:hypothetical protein
MKAILSRHVSNAGTRGTTADKGSLKGSRDAEAEATEAAAWSFPLAVGRT